MRAWPKRSTRPSLFMTSRIPTKVVVHEQALKVDTFGQTVGGHQDANVASAQLLDCGLSLVGGQLASDGLDRRRLELRVRLPGMRAAGDVAAKHDRLEAVLEQNSQMLCSLASRRSFALSTLGVGVVLLPGARAWALAISSCRRRLSSVWAPGSMSSVDRASSVLPAPGRRLRAFQQVLSQ